MEIRIRFQLAGWQAGWLVVLNLMPGTRIFCYHLAYLKVL